MYIYIYIYIYISRARAGDVYALALGNVAARGDHEIVSCVCVLLGERDNARSYAVCLTKMIQSCNARFREIKTPTAEHQATAVCRYVAHSKRDSPRQIRTAHKAVRFNRSLSGCTIKQD